MGRSRNPAEHGTLFCSYQHERMVVRKKAGLEFPNLKYERYSPGYYILLVKAIHILLVVYPTYNDQILESEFLMQTTFTAVIGSKADPTTKRPKTPWQCSIRI